MLLSFIVLGKTMFFFLLRKAAFMRQVTLGDERLIPTVNTHDIIL